ncbi:MAG: hypothetical protein U9Q85_01010 [Patescibacteria group bacterium]|nr:hypothetical protein [Patescibacteria group bacterium]
MKFNFNIKIFKLSSIFALAFFILFFSLSGIAQAGSADNTTGFAWSDTVGWISFNNTNCDSDEDGTTDTGNFTQCQEGEVSFDYGVNIDSVTGNFSGYAWSNNVGWIYFGPDANLGAPYNLVQETDAPVTANNSQIWANYNSGTGDITGWAKILSMGEDGWISFGDDDTSDSIDYGISGDPGTEEFSGMAWNGNNDNTGIGWISFNSIDCDVDTNNFVDVACGGDNTSDTIFDYKAMSTGFNTPPYADNFSVFFDEDKMCESGTGGNPYFQYFLRWDYFDYDEHDSSSYYLELVESSWNYGTKNIIGDVIGTTQNLTVASGTQMQARLGDLWPYESNLASYTLNWDTEYKWRVTVTDVPGSSSTTDSNINFTTPEHEYPIPVFYRNPFEISEQTSAKFIGGEDSMVLSEYYDGVGSKNSCTVDETNTNCNYNWQPDAVLEISIDDNALASSFITFNEKVENFTIDLNLTDADGYSCATSVDLSTYLPLPTWIEN